MKQELDIQLEEDALEDIRIGYRWYEDQLIGLGDEFKNSVHEAFKTIANSPNGYEHFGKHRQYPMDRFPFIILYEVVNSTLYIDAVFHTSQDPVKKNRL